MRSLRFEELIIWLIWGPEIGVFWFFEREILLLEELIILERKSSFMGLFHWLIPGMNEWTHYKEAIVESMEALELLLTLRRVRYSATVTEENGRSEGRFFLDRKLRNLRRLRQYFWVVELSLPSQMFCRRGFKRESCIDDQTDWPLTNCKSITNIRCVGLTFYPESQLSPRES